MIRMTITIINKSHKELYSGQGPITICYDWIIEWYTIFFLTRQSIYKTNKSFVQTKLNQKKRAKWIKLLLCCPSQDDDDTILRLCHLGEAWTTKRQKKVISLCYIDKQLRGSKNGCEKRQTQHKHLFIFHSSTQKTVFDI